VLGKHEIVKITDTSSVQNKHSEEKVNVCICTQECIRVREGGLYKGRSKSSLVSKKQKQKENPISILSVGVVFITSIKSLLAPSAIAANPSNWSGSKSISADVRYSPAGVVFASSLLDFTIAPLIPVLS